MRRQLSIVPFLTVLLLVGCASLGVPTAEKFGERAAAATTSLNTASQTDLTLLQARKITPDESDAYIARIDELQQAIDVARTLHATDVAAGEDKLALTINALNILLAELEKRK